VQIVHEVLQLLNAEGRHWTARSVRLWFTNNKKHYPDDPLRRPPPPQRPRLPLIPSCQVPQPYHCTFIPVNMHQIPMAAPVMWPVAADPNVLRREQSQEPPANPETQPWQVPIQYFPLPEFKPPKR
jgi:hypothetical protein